MNAPDVIVADIPSTTVLSVNPLAHTASWRPPVKMTLSVIALPW